MEKKRIFVAGGTFAVAIAIGFVMQNTDALAALDETQTAPEIAVQTASVVPAIALPDAAPVRPDVADQLTTTAAEPAVNCDIAFNLRPQPAAVLEGIVSAPCEPNARGTVHHDGMMFSFVTDAIGGATFDVPVLSASATVIVAFDSGEGAMAQRDVPSLAQYDRVVVQWRGDTGAALHAFEMNADYGDTGHIWSGAAKAASRSEAALGGFLMELGNIETSNPFKAQVYTFPTAMSRLNGNVALSIETEVLAQTCGRDVSTQTIQISPNQERVVHDLTLAMPACDAIGDFVVMAAPLQDLQLASR